MPALSLEKLCYGCKIFTKVSFVHIHIHGYVQIREGSSELIPDAWINLGHMYLYTNQPNLAVDIYTKCMNKFFDGQGLHGCEGFGLTKARVIFEP